MPTSTPSIQFTHEVEENGLLPFLDTEITYHTDGSQSTKVHRKPTHTDKQFDFPPGTQGGSGLDTIPEGRVPLHIC